MFQILTVVTFGTESDSIDFNNGGRAIAVETLQFPTERAAELAFQKLSEFRLPRGVFSAIKLY